MSEKSDSNEWVSKSSRKRDMIALQNLGKELLSLNDALLAKLTLTEELLGAISEYKRLPNKNEAKRRQLQFIGRLMRDAKIDADAIRQTLAMQQQDVERQKRHFHHLENLRESLVAGDNRLLEQMITDYPDLDIQHFRQLIRQAQKESASETPRTANRKLFRYLKDLIRFNQA